MQPRPADLAAPPGNQLEALKRKLAGKHSIPINDRWTDGGPEDVELMDYHCWPPRSCHPFTPERFRAKTSLRP